MKHLQDHGSVAGKSAVDTWMTNFAKFMKAVGTVPDVPDPKSFTGAQTAGRRQHWV
jgi:hypothetical protein